MKIQRLPVLLVSVALAYTAGCSSGPPSVGARFRGPTAVAPFMGYTTKRVTADGSPSAYLAVASSGSDELRILDAADDLPALGPGVVFPLSVPTEPRPVMLASTSLGDGKADLLVVVSAGSHDLQLVTTWSPDVTIVDPPLSLAKSSSLPQGLEADATILCLRAMKVTTAGGQSLARVLVGASASPSTPGSKPRLLVVDFARQADGSVAEQSMNAQQLDFRPVDIATPVPDGTLTPEEAMRLFLATPDPIPTGAGQSVLGVARVQSTADVSELPWTVTALDARAPTVAVAAASVAERSATAPDTFADPQLRIYAVLDPGGCGPDQAIDCGVVTLRDPPAVDAVGNLETDPSGQMGYRAPMQVPGVPVAIAIATPVESGTGRITSGAIPLQLIAPGSGQRNTTAVAAVSSTSGRVYLLDLGRWGVMDDTSLLTDASTRVAVATAQSALPTISDTADPDFGKTAQLGLWNDFPANAKGADVATAVTAGSDMTSFVQVTPGFTESDTWTITWRGPLPQLSARRGILVSDGTALYAALQSADGQNVDVQVGAPELGVLPGDLVEFPDTPSCGLDGSGRRIRSDATVAEVLPPGSPAVAGVPLPGGALKLVSPLPCQGVLPIAGVGASSPLRLTVRAGGLVLTSTNLGVVGRPAPDTQLSANSQAFSFEWQDESTLSEVDLVTARKARRRFYPTDPPCASLVPGCYAGLPWLANPLDPGPVLAFKVGLFPQGATLDEVPRGASIQLVTRSGFVPTSRGPATGGTVPGGPLFYDKTAQALHIAGRENDPVHFYVPFLDDQVIDFSPAGSSTDVVTIR